MIEEFKIETVSDSIEQDARARFPFGKLKIGESFVVSHDLASKIRRAAGTFNQHRKHLGVKISVKKCSAGLRCKMVVRPLRPLRLLRR